MTTETRDTIRVFDETTHRRRLDRAAPRFRDHAFLFDEIAERLLDRLGDVTRPFGRVLDLGGRDGFLTERLTERRGTERVFALDPSAAMLRGVGASAVVADAGLPPFADESFDLVVSNAALHWVNDLPGALIQIRRALKPDGFFLAAMAGGGTLARLRGCLMEAEIAATGGAAARISPLIDVRTAGDLLARAGFALPVADREMIVVDYADPSRLLVDLRGMGETAAFARGEGRPLRRDVLFGALERLAAEGTTPDGRVPITFEVVFLAGWAPPA